MTDFASLIFHPSTEKSEYSFTNPEVYYEYSSAKGLIECSLSILNKDLKVKISEISIFNIFTDLGKDDEIVVDIKMKSYNDGKTYKSSFIINGWELLEGKMGKFPQDNFNIIFNHNFNILYEKMN